MRSERVIMLPATATGRLDAALARASVGLSRRQLKQAFAEDRVLVCGRSVSQSHVATPGLRVTLVELDGLSDLGKVATAPLEVIWSDPVLIVVDKLAGMPAYALSATEGNTLAGAVLERFPDVTGVGDLKLAPGLCHRLDKETSGLLLFARTVEAFGAVRAQFRRRQVRKVYDAVVGGRLEGEGLVDVALGRRRGENRRMRAASGSARLRRSWPARTRWCSKRSDAERTLVELVLETGVTHQARVHMAVLGHPIVGDSLYGGPPHSRLLLHAAELGLEHPVTGERMIWKSPHRLDIDS
jgi:23S rRNA pseudouridine1911/1915/1917 synthase